MATQQQLSTINSNNQVGIDIPGPEELINAAANELGGGGNPRQLARPLLLIGSWTLVGVFNRIVGKLPPGAIFESNLIAYYLTLFGVFLAGVAEVYSAILLSSAQDGGRVRAIAAPLLCASVVLLTALVTFGGSPVPVMG
ncbi:unnamed protein product [Urochloa decumbens]|uniref:Uncharacterized protein n=1 Tax=Urochloa decumbens TaxID=240449 RepID=A0ABC8ZQS8_9POAL